MNNKDIIAQLREWARSVKIGHPWIAAREMRALAARLEAEPASPTLADVVTPEEAKTVLDVLCFSLAGDGKFCPVPDVSIEGPNLIEGPICLSDSKEPPASAKLCHWLWARAKEGK